MKWNNSIAIGAAVCTHMEAPFLLDFLSKKNSGMYIVFARLNDTVFASTADRLLSNNLFMLLLSKILLILFQ